MLCAISGEPPQAPVVSSKSGSVYEKRLIETYITENGTEPTTGDTLTIEDLIDLKTQKTVRPRPPTLTSIPSLLSVFQEEWDALALETYTLRQNLAQTRQDLSNALYQHDAAVRVIARVTKERDEAREALASLNIRSGADTNGDAMHIDPTPLHPKIVSKIDSTKDSLMKTRRKRPLPEDWATGDDISSYKQRSQSKPFRAGDKAFSIHQSGDLALVGGASGVVNVYSTSKNKVQQSLQCDGGVATDALWVGDQAAITTSSGKVLIFSPLSDSTPGSFQAHSGPATAIAVHPSGEILASVGEDGTYVLYDLLSMTQLTKVPTNTKLTCAQFHPDGHLLAVGTNEQKDPSTPSESHVRIFNVSNSQEGGTIPLSSPVKALKFSENGIWIAIITEGSTAISIWDIRKIPDGELKGLETEGVIESIDWDYTAQFLASAGEAGTVVQQYSKANKGWTEVLKVENAGTSVAWGKAAHSLVTTSDEGVVTVLSN